MRGESAGCIYRTSGAGNRWMFSSVFGTRTPPSAGGPLPLFQLKSIALQVNRENARSKGAHAATERTPLSPAVSGAAANHYAGTLTF